MGWRPPLENGDDMPLAAREQIGHARDQLASEDRLHGARWAIHPQDLTELRTVIGDAESLFGLWFKIVADPEAAGIGPQLMLAEGAEPP